MGAQFLERPHTRRTSLCTGTLGHDLPGGGDYFVVQVEEPFAKTDPTGQRIIDEQCGQMCEG
jgi:hypothetical protein